MSYLRSAFKIKRYTLVCFNELNDAVNYIIGLVVIFAILVACPYLVRGIAYLVAH